MRHKQPMTHEVKRVIHAVRSKLLMSGHLLGCPALLEAGDHVAIRGGLRPIHRRIGESRHVAIQAILQAIPLISLN